MATQKFFRAVLTAMAASAMLAGSAFLAAQDENAKTEKASKQRQSYFFWGLNLVESPSGLLGDMTKRSIGVGWTFGDRLFFPNDKWALQMKWNLESWGERRFQGADNEKISVIDTGLAIGVAYFLGSKPYTEDRYYFSFDLGAGYTMVRPQSHEKRRWADNTAAAIKFGYGDREVYFEAGVEAKFINANEMGYTGYNRFSPRFVLTLGFGGW